MKYKLLIILSFLLAVQVSWGSDQKEKKGDDKSQSVIPNPVQGVVYALPRTVFCIKVKTVKESYRPGPYAAFAEKYLGYQGAKTSATDNWKITGVKVVCLGESDPDAVFKTPGISATMVSLWPDGTIAGINSPIPFQQESGIGNDQIDNSSLPDVVFPDLSSDDQYDVEVNSATGEETMKFKPLEVKAREAADYLFRLRKKRAFTSVTPTDGVPADGKAFEVFLAKEDILEKEYLALFLGKTITSEHENTILFTPGAESVKSEVVFRFSDDKGILPKSDISGKPVTLDLTKDQKHYSAIEGIYQPLNVGAPRSGLFYRIPVNASLILSEGFNTLFSGRYPVAQYGLVSPVPDLLINEFTRINFDRVTGAITHCELTK